jgi:hypothetical protein
MYGYLTIEFTYSLLLYSQIRQPLESINVSLCFLYGIGVDVCSMGLFIVAGTVMVLMIMT